MRALVRAALPEHAVFGEEGGMTPGEGASPSEYLWIFDPIDGTKSFITGAQAQKAFLKLHQNKKQTNKQTNTWVHGEEA